MLTSYMVFDMEGGPNILTYCIFHCSLSAQVKWEVIDSPPSS